MFKDQQRLNIKYWAICYIFFIAFYDKLWGISCWKHDENPVENQHISISKSRKTSVTPLMVEKSPLCALEGLCWVLRALWIVITPVWDCLILGEQSPSLHPPFSLLRGCGRCCAASLQSERDVSATVSTCLLWGAVALMWSWLNRVPLWRLDNWSAPPHSYPILSTVCMSVHERFAWRPTYTLMFSKEWAEQLDTPVSLIKWSPTFSRQLLPTNSRGAKQWRNPKKCFCLTIDSSRLT